MQVHFIRHIFTTLTYEHTIQSKLAWERISKDYNRYIQKLRRLHVCPVQYLRTVEQHKTNDYPHIHTILQFPDARIRIENSKFFTRTLHSKWKSTWSHGLSDYQVPRTKGTSQLNYILKYITKNSTSNTVWKKIYQCAVNSADVPPCFTNMEHSKQRQIAGLQSDFSVSPVTKNGVKLCSWSRNFDFSPFYSKTNQIALS